MTFDIFTPLLVSAKETDREKKNCAIARAFLKKYILERCGVGVVVVHVRPYSLLFFSWRAPNKTLYDFDFSYDSNNNIDEVFTRGHKFSRENGSRDSFILNDHS